MRDGPQSVPFVGQARCLGIKLYIRKYLLKGASLLRCGSYEAEEVDFFIAVIIL